MLMLYGLVIAFGGCADRLILHPRQGHIDAGRARRTLVAAPGPDVEVWVARSPAAATEDDVEAYVLEFCGNATRAEQIAQFVADRWHRFPVEVWVMNYPGYGGSEGRPRLDDIPPAALATYDALAAKADRAPVFLCGNSLGTTPALFVAANRPAAGLILQNPPPLRRLLMGKYGWWNAWLAAAPVALQVPTELNSTGTAPRVGAPAVFLMADRDEVVPLNYQRIVADAYGGEKRVIELRGARHGSSVRGDAEAELQRAMDWLWQHAFPTTRPAGPAREGRPSCPPRDAGAGRAALVLPLVVAGVTVTAAGCADRLILPPGSSGGVVQVTHRPPDERAMGEVQDAMG